MAAKVVKQWGDLEGYTEVGSSGRGRFALQGIRFGNIVLGVQPLLGHQ